MNVLEMKNKRAQLLQENDDLTNVAKREGRLASDEEVAKMTANLDEAEMLESRINIAERAEAAKVRATASVPKSVKTVPQITVTENSDEFRSFGHMLMAVKDAGQGRPADHRLFKTRSVSGLSEGTPADGGYLVATEYSTALLQRVFDNSMVLNAVTPITIGANANTLKIPYVDEQSRADGYRAGGLQLNWIDEAADKVSSKPKFNQITFTLEKLIGLCYATDELLQDAAVLESYINSVFPREFQTKLVDAIINGNGTGLPLGIMQSAALVTSVRTTAGTVKAEDIANMYSRQLNPGKAIWLANQSLMPTFMGMVVSGTQVPIYVPGQSLANAPYGMLLGRPVVWCESCAAKGTTGDIIFADMSAYGFATKGGLQTAQSIHVRFTNDETVFRFVYRCDGQPLFPSTVSGTDGVTRSEFICLS